MLLTKQLLDGLLDRGASDKGSWNKAQLLAIGVAWPPLYGWKHRMIGTELRQSQIDEFLDLKNAHLEKKKSIAAVENAIREYIKNMAIDGDESLDAGLIKQIADETIDFMRGPRALGKIERMAEARREA